MYIFLTIIVSTILSSALAGDLTDLQKAKIEKAGVILNNSLAKTNAATLALTQYINASVNLAFECPTGWTITDTLGLPGLCFLTVTNPFRQTSILIFACKESTIDEAERFGPTDCFWDDWQSSKMSQYVPTLYYVYDSTINTTKFAHNQVKDKDNTNTVTHVRTRYTQSSSLYYHSMAYRTTIADFTANSASYDASWNNLLFIQTSIILSKAAINPVGNSFSINKGLITVDLKTQQDIKLQLFDIRGRLLKQLYSGNLNGEASFDISKMNTPFIVNFKTNHSESKLILPHK